MGLNTLKYNNNNNKIINNNNYDLIRMIMIVLDIKYVTRLRHHNV